MPDGGAVENGALLSANELEKCGYFVHSPSDDVPVLPNQKKDDDEKDKTYKPPKHSSTLDDEAPEQIYGSDGEELVSETDYGHKLVRPYIHMSNPASLYRYLAREKGTKKETRNYGATKKNSPTKEEESHCC